jgi:uncharacterized protein YodC (DUF2158 family)
MATTLKVGDTVKLKSGGPLMTITLIELNTVYCSWFNDKNELKYGQFSPDALIQDSK